MAIVSIILPDTLAREADRAGLLAPARVERWLREQIKTTRVDALFASMDRAGEADDPAAMTPEDVAREVAAMRRDRAPRRGG